MRRIVFDIETCAYPFETLSESQQEYLLRYAEKEVDPDKKQEQTDQAIRYTSLYPLTAKCVAIGIYDIDKNKSFVYYENAEAQEWFSEDELVHYKGVTESEMLKSFWKIIKVTDQVVTFNGRNFDLPLRDAREKFEKAYLEYQLKQANGSVSKIAQSAMPLELNLRKQKRFLAWK